MKRIIIGKETLTFSAEKIIIEIALEVCMLHYFTKDIYLQIFALLPDWSKIRKPDTFEWYVKIWNIGQWLSKF